MLTDAPLPLITPVLLAGGSGTRLWPLSRASRPKQFAPLLGEASLFQDTATRLSGPGYTAPMVMTRAAFRFLVAEQLQEAGIDPGPIVLEPAARNTAPAILAAALHLQARSPGALMLVAPSDHHMTAPQAFGQAVDHARDAALKGAIVTFGITAHSPETGYGYLRADTPAAGDPVGPRPVRQFIEKPQRPAAEALLAEGGALWNAGIFLMRADTLIAAARTHAPDLIAPVEAALERAETDLGFLRLAPAPWDGAPDISVDYAVMEHHPDVVVQPVDCGWSELGAWDAVRALGEPDAGGTVTQGAATAIDCTGSFLRSEEDSPQLVGLGLEGMMAVALPDAVLVAPLDRAQEVGRAVSELRAKGASVATQHSRDHRPWGWFETLSLGDRFRVKRIHVKPGGRLSLQSHMHRAEHWVVVGGTVRVTIDDEVRLISENQSVYVPLGSVHRLENEGLLGADLIEVQTGAYLGEDDITRLEDVYAREKTD